MKTSPEQSVDRQPGSLPTSGLRIRPLAILLLGVLFILFCALLYLSLASRPRFNPRNTPEALLANSAFESLTNLPELPDLATNLSSADLAFGEEQMERMAKDRPELMRFVLKNDPIWQFCVRAFAGAAIGERIKWDNTLPERQGYRAESLGPYKGRSGFIRIRSSSDSADDRDRVLGCEELWACCVYEIENIRNHKAFMALFNRALAGKLSREEWIRGCSRLEYNALQRESMDFTKVWLPLARTRQISITRNLWGADSPPTYEEWISLYRDPDSYPWEVFGTYYDRKVVPYVKGMQRWQNLSR